MAYGKKGMLVRAIALLLVLSLISPICASAAVNDSVQPRASNYLDSYNAYVCAMGGGDLQIWFTVVGDKDMDDIGTLRIMLYESSNNSSWTWVETFLHEDYESMLAHDDYFHSSYVSYDGTAGKYYKAYVCIYAGIGDNGDTRYMWTASERAT